MKNLSTLILLFLLIACNNNGEGWRPLFQETEKDWTEAGNAKWIFENGELIGSVDSQDGYVITNDRFKDFQLRLEFFPDSSINSGVFIRCGEEMSPLSCYEINIWDNHPNQEYRTGAVVTLSKPLAYVETIGKWNSYEIKAEGDHIQAWINGVQTADLRDRKFVKGRIALQAAEKGRIKFRKVLIKEL